MATRIRTALFELETGVPDGRLRSRAGPSKDGFLVPPKAVSVPLKFQREGITYDDLTHGRKSSGTTPNGPKTARPLISVEAAAVNKWLFNEDTVDKVLEHLMTRGQKVAGGRPTREVDHFREEPGPRRIHRRSASTPELPALQGHVRARRWHCKLTYAQTLIDNFSVPAKAAAHRNFGGHARHRDRCPGSREPGLL